MAFDLHIRAFMRFRVMVALSMTLVGILGCGKGSPEPNPAPSRAEIAEPPTKAVIGNAEFGNYCPLGSYSPPQPVPLALWDCPTSLTKVELTERLRAFNLQADCKKKTLDVRSPSKIFEPVTWEIMPDGNFYFSMDGGVAHLKDDGAGNLDCAVPLQADLWGRVDCQDIDKPVIRVETVWWIGKTLEHPNSPIGTPSITPIPTGVPLPFPSPNPSLTPLPSPPPSPRPSPSEIPTPRPSRMFVPASSPSEVPPQSAICKMPTGCYFHTLLRIDQCS